jgi:hypothetical protein
MNEVQTKNNTIKEEMQNSKELKRLKCFSPSCAI